MAIQVNSPTEVRVCNVHRHVRYQSDLHVGTDMETILSSHSSQTWLISYITLSVLSLYFSFLSSVQHTNVSTIFTNIQNASCLLIFFLSFFSPLILLLLLLLLRS